MNFVENKYLKNFDIIFFRESKYNYENLYYEEQSQNLVNWVYFKKYVNKVFSAQEG